MIIYNITYSIDPEVANTFINWMKENHTPKIANLQEVDNLKIFKLRTQLEDGHGVNFTFQYSFANEMAFCNFKDHKIDELRNEVFRKFHGFYADFDTVLDEV